MRKKWIVFLAFAILAGGCQREQADTDAEYEIIAESETSIETEGLENTISNLSKITAIKYANKCTYEECPEVYEAIEQLLAARTAMQFEISSPDIDLNSEFVIEQENSLYYPVNSGELSTKDAVKEKLSEVYDTNYIDDIIIPELFESEVPLYLEQDRQLYAMDVGAVILGIRDDWSLWEVNENCYYVQGALDSESESIVILVVTRTSDGEGFQIEQEIEMEF